MAVGTLAGAGTLGLLIPPSIIMIVYGVAAEVSIAKLFIAGVLPGILLALLFSGYIVVWALLHPEQVPPPPTVAGLHASKLHESRHLIPVVLLIGRAGLDLHRHRHGHRGRRGGRGRLAGAVGCAGLADLADLQGLADGRHAAVLHDRADPRRRGLPDAGMGYIGLPRHLAEWIASLGLSPVACSCWRWRCSTSCWAASSTASRWWC
jgi:hypothetical protein